MAKTPRYENKQSLIQTGQELLTPQFGESINRSKSIQRSLDVVTKYAESENKRNVITQAEEFTVANPLTMDQLDAARSSGINPIKQALNGGLVWNDAIKKLYAQQTSAELTAQSYKHYDSTLARVESGELTDPNLIQEALEGPVKSYRDVLATMDPAEANRFYAQSINNGGVYYRKALADLRVQEQERQDVIAYDNYRGMIRTFQLEIVGMEPTALLAKYQNDMLEAKQLFKNSAQSKTYQNEVEKEFTAGLYSHIAQQLVGTYSSTEDAMQAMNDGKLGQYTEIWKELVPTQKNALEAIVKSQFKDIDAAQAKKLTGIKASVTDISKKLIDNEDPDRYNDNILDLKAQAKTLTGSAYNSAQAAIEELQATKTVADRLRPYSITDMEREVEVIRANLDIPDFYLTTAQAYYDKAKKAYDQDSVAYELRRTKGIPGQILYDEATQSMSLSGFKSQLDTINSSKNRSPGGPVLSKPQLNAIVDALSSPDALTKAAKVALAVNIVDTFGNSADDVFRQIAPKNPIFANNGFLVTDNPATVGTVQTTIRGQAMMDGGLQLAPAQLKASKSRMDFVASMTGNTEDSNRILAAAEAYYVGDGGDLTILNEVKMENAIWASSGGYIGNDGDKYGGTTRIGDRLVMIGDQFKTDEIPTLIANSPIESFANAVVNNADMVGATIMGRNSVTGKEEAYNILDLQDASLMRVDDNYMLVGEDNSVFNDVNGNPIIIDLQKMKDDYDMASVYGSLYDPIPNTIGRGLDAANLRRQDEYAKRREREIVSGKKETVNSRKSKIGY